MMLKNKCIVCGGEIFHKIADIELAYVGETSLFECGICGFRTCLEVRREKIEAVYAMKTYFLTEDMRFGYADYKKDNTPLEERKGRALARFLKQNYGDFKGRILEVGCATAVTLKTIKGLSGWDVYGVDLSEWAIDQGRNSGLDNMFCGNLEDADFSDNYFDVILLFDILEHVFDPSCFMRNVRRLLKRKGVIVLQIPNGVLDIKPFLRKAGKVTLSPHWHLHFFSVNNLRSFFINNGLLIKKLEFKGFYEALIDLGWLSSPRQKLLNQKRHYSVRYKNLSYALKNNGLYLLLERLFSKLRFGHAIKALLTKD